MTSLRTLAASLAAALALLPACKGEDRAAAKAQEGLELARQGQLAEAAERFDEALSIDPASAPALYNGGLALVGLGRYAEAEDRFEAFTHLHPQDALGWLELARVRVSLGAKEPGFAALQRSVDAGLASHDELLRDDVFRPFYTDPRFVSLQMVVARRDGVKPSGGVLEGTEGEEQYGAVPLRNQLRPGPVRDGPCPGQLARGDDGTCG